MGTRWRHLLAPVGVPTGDGRRFAAGSITHRELPLALKWQRSDEPGHDTSVSVASIDAIDVGEGEVWGEGEWFDDIDPATMPRLAQDVAEAMHLYNKGVLGPSVDAGAATAMEVDAATGEPLTDEQWIAAAESGEMPDMELLFSHYEIAAATLVPIPAYAETATEAANGDTEPADEPDAVVAAVTGSTDLPVAARETSWDGDAAAGRVFDQFTDGDTVDVDAVSRAFLWRDPDADPQLRGSYKLGFADWIDGELRIVPAGVAATAGGRGVDAADVGGDADAIKTRICSLYGVVRSEFDDWPECPFADEPAEPDGPAAEVAAARFALVASAPLIDAGLFDDPGLTEVTPFTYDPATGRVFGHLATFDTCHVGYKSMCVAPPESVTDYALFHRYPLDTTAGLVPAGRITTGHGTTGTGCQHAGCAGLDDHACTETDFAGAVAHHDRMRTLAHVRVGVDETNNAIWFAGLAAPNLTVDDVAVMSRREVSGDWRDHAGSLELGEILALASANPGFPLPHAAIRDGRQVALVAAAPVRPPVVAAALSQEDLVSIADDLTRIAARLTEALPEEEEDEPEGDAMPPGDDGPDMTGVVAALQSTVNRARGQLASRQVATILKETAHVLRK